MEIKINVDDAMFQEVFDKELKALDPEDIRKILLEGIAEYFRSSEYKPIKDLIFERDRYTGYSSPVPSKFITQLAENTDVTALQPIVDKCIEELETNYKSILIDLLTNIFVDSLVDKFTMSNSLNMAIRRTVGEALSDRNQ